MFDEVLFNYCIECILDKPFSLDDRSKGWDCLNSILFVYRSMGYKFPSEIEGWTEKNYASKWLEDGFEGREIQGKLLYSLGKHIEKNFYQKGDLMIFSGKEITDFPGFYLGNGNVLMVFDRGARVVPLHLFENALKEVRRLIE